MQTALCAFLQVCSSLSNAHALHGSRSLRPLQVCFRTSSCSISCAACIYKTPHCCKCCRQLRLSQQMQTMSRWTLRTMRMAFLAKSAVRASLGKSGPFLNALSVQSAQGLLGTSAKTGATAAQSTLFVLWLTISWSAASTQASRALNAEKMLRLRRPSPLRFSPTWKRLRPGRRIGLMWKNRGVVPTCLLSVAVVQLV